MFNEQNTHRRIEGPTLLLVSPFSELLRCDLMEAALVIEERKLTSELCYLVYTMSP